MRLCLCCVLSILGLASPGLAQQAPAPTGPEAIQRRGRHPRQPRVAWETRASAGAATELPPVKVIVKPPKPKKKRPAVTAGGAAKGKSPAANAVSTGQTPAEAASNAAVVSRRQSLNAARENILPKIGVNSYEVSQQDIQALPQGDNVPIDKLLLQTPGVYQDSAVNGGIHIRDEHANVQYRIDGIQLPDGVSGFGQVLETSLIGNMAVVTGALPAQYGLRTAGLVDIQTRTGTAEPSGEWSVYGGSHDTISTNLQYGGVSGNTQYFFTGRWLENSLGIENPTSSVNAIHDETEQEKFFTYVSTVLPNNARWTVITGAADGTYQIPNNPGQPVQYYYSPTPGTPTLTAFDSSKLNENQIEQNYYGVLAFQQSTAFVDYQLSYFTRYSSLHYTPDLIGDLMFNGIATDLEPHQFPERYSGGQRVPSCAGPYVARGLRGQRRAEQCDGRCDGFSLGRRN